MGKIIFFGPVQPNKLNVVGGGESGNRKTIALLQQLGYTITILEKPYLHNGAISYAWELFKNCLKLPYYRFKGASTLHIAGYYFNSIYYEFLLVLIAKMLFMKVIYEARAGGFVTAYTSRSKIYRATTKRLLTYSDEILCQGLEYVDFIEQELGLRASYYPNFILETYIEQNEVLDRVANLKKIQLVYFGRVNENKNILFLVNICKELKHKIDFELEIIGAYSDHYHDLLIKHIEDAQLGKQIKLFPPKKFQDLKEILKKKHVFLFPTKESREGHSNSLTEAMAFGVVPLVSDQGFNRTVLSNDTLVVNAAEPGEYAKRIIEIGKPEHWETYSHGVHQRVLDNYTEKIVLKTLCSVYAINH